MRFKQDKIHQRIRGPSKSVGLRPVNPQSSMTRICHQWKTKTKKSFIKDLIIPEAVRLVQSKIKIKAGGSIPPFDPIQNFCDDSKNKDPTFKITTNFHKKRIDADFLLYVAVVQKNIMGYAFHVFHCLEGS